MLPYLMAKQDQIKSHSLYICSVLKFKLDGQSIFALWTVNTTDGKSDLSKWTKLNEYLFMHRGLD